MWVTEISRPGDWSSAFFEYSIYSIDIMSGMKLKTPGLGMSVTHVHAPNLWSSCVAQSHARRRATLKSDGSACRRSRTPAARPTRRRSSCGTTCRGWATWDSSRLWCQHHHAPHVNRRFSVCVSVYIYGCQTLLNVYRAQ